MSYLQPIPAMCDNKIGSTVLSHYKLRLDWNYWDNMIKNPASGSLIKID